MPVSNGYPDLGRLTVMASLHASGDGTLHAAIRSIDEAQHLSIDSSAIFVTIWRESSEIVRCSVRHPASSAVAYAQGTGALAEFADAIGLKLS